MLNLEPTANTGHYVLSLTGAVTEKTDFSVDLPSDVNHLEVDCAKLDRINSMGISKWILFFNQVRIRRIQIQFLNLNVALVNLCNFVSGMVEKDEVRSLRLPYFCETCNVDIQPLVTVEYLREKKFRLDPAPCATCGVNADFDGIPIHYFEFLYQNS